MTSLKTAVFTSNNQYNNLFFSKISDAVDLSQIRHKNCYLGFLNEAEIYKAEEFLHNITADFCFWGGYEQAQRKFLCVLYDDFDKSLVPISAIEFIYRTADVLSHRDFLGTLMSLGIERNAVGDILTQRGRAVVFVKNELKSYICTQLSKVGGVGVKIKDTSLDGLPAPDELSEMSIIVSSLRLDAVIAVLIGNSREKTQKLISQGNVLVNYSPCLSYDKKLHNSDVVTVRGHGKFIIKSVNGETKKGRLKLSVQLFR